jgi:hypothetical protein
LSDNAHHNSQAPESFHRNLTIVSPLRGRRGIISFTVKGLFNIDMFDNEEERSYPALVHPRFLAHV